MQGGEGSARVPQVTAWVSEGSFPATRATAGTRAHSRDKDGEQEQGADDRAITLSAQRGRSIAVRMLATLEERYQAQIAAQQALIDELRVRAERAEQALVEERGRAAAAPRREEVAALHQVQERNLSELAALRRQLGLQERIGEQDRTLAVTVQPPRPGFFGRLFGGARERE